MGFVGGPLGEGGGFVGWSVGDVVSVRRGGAEVGGAGGSALTLGPSPTAVGEG